MPKINIGDIEINYQEQGRGIPLIILHGLNSDISGWVFVMPELAKYYRTIAVDVRGHGESGKPDIPYSIRMFSDDLYNFCQKLQISEAHILGLSMGGAIAQQFALLYKEMIRSLILVSTFSYIDDHLKEAFLKLRRSLDTGGYPAFFDEVVKLAFTPKYIRENPESIATLKEKRIKINSPVAIARATEACLNFNLKDEISRINLPTLILSGREDVFTPLHLAEQIHQSIKGSEWKIIDNVGHNLHIEKPEEMVEAVLEFLKRN